MQRRASAASPEKRLHLSHDSRTLKTRADRSQLHILRRQLFHRGTCFGCCANYHLARRYITEGTFRASHHKLQEKLQSDDPRRCAQPPGLPNHSFEQMDAQLLAAGRPIRCHFTLLPTSFSFGPVGPWVAYPALAEKCNVWIFCQPR